MRILFACLFLFVAAPAWAAPVLLVYGDSLSAAYGLPAKSGWAALLESRLAEQRPAWQVVNASVSGETTAGGLARLPAVLDRHRPAVVVLELGANDGLRGLPLSAAKANLKAMATLAERQGARVLLVGMQLPPNYGTAYTREFRAIYPAVAKSAGLALAPFLLDGLAAEPALFQADGLHPTAAAQPRLLENVWPHLLPLLTAGPGRGTGAGRP